MPSNQKSIKTPLTSLRRVIQIISFILIHYVILELIFDTQLTAFTQIFRAVPFLHTANDAWSGGAGFIEYVFWSLTQGEFPYLFIGLIGIFSLLLGRFTCGWICPTGLAQDLLSKFSREHKQFTIESDLRLKKLKIYLFILLVIIIAPLGYYLRNDPGQYVLYTTSVGKLKDNPTGPFSLSDFLFYTIPTFIKDVFQYTRFTFIFSGEYRARIVVFFIYLIIMGMSIVYPRFYCKYLCLYGAVSRLFAEYSLLKLKRLPARCVGRKKCGSCERVCDMQIRILDEPYTGYNGKGECILCLKCMEVCDLKGYDAIKIKFGL